jgi:hypothetical protein
MGMRPGLTMLALDLAMLPMLMLRIVLLREAILSEDVAVNALPIRPRLPIARTGARASLRAAEVGWLAIVLLTAAGSAVAPRASTWGGAGGLRCAGAERRPLILLLVLL